MTSTYKNKYIIPPEGCEERQSKVGEIMGTKATAILDDYLNEKIPEINSMEDIDNLCLGFIGEIEAIVNDSCMDLMTTEDCIYIAKDVTFRAINDMLKMKLMLYLMSMKGWKGE